MCPLFSPVDPFIEIVPDHLPFFLSAEILKIPGEIITPFCILILGYFWHEDELWSMLFFQVFEQMLRYRMSQKRNQPRYFWH
jgi:hypothetical protein